MAACCLLFLPRAALFNDPESTLTLQEVGKAVTHRQMIVGTLRIIVVFLKAFVTFYLEEEEHLICFFLR